MNTTDRQRARKEGIVAVIALVVLLIGTATGSAVAMFILAVLGMAIVAVIYARTFNLKTALVIATSMLIAFAIAVGVALTR